MVPLLYTDKPVKDKHKNVIIPTRCTVSSYSTISSFKADEVSVHKAGSLFCVSQVSLIVLVRPDMHLRLCNTRQAASHQRAFFKYGKYFHL